MHRLEGVVVHGSEPALRDLTGGFSFWYHGIRRAQKLSQLLPDWVRPLWGVSWWLWFDTKCGRDGVLEVVA